MDVPAVDIDASPPAQTRRLLVPLLVGGLVVAVAAAATLGVLLASQTGISSSDVSDYLAERSGAVETRSGRVIELLLNYDSSNLDEIATKMLTISTGNFRQQYDELLGSGLQDALEGAAASSRGQILDGPEVSFRTPSEAVAIARVSQTTQSSSAPGGRTFEYVLELTFVDTTDGGWKADRVEILSQRTAN